MSGLRVLAEKDISKAVEELAARASVDLPGDVEEALRNAKKLESGSGARYALEMILENARIARLQKLPLCQDTGFFHLFIEIGEGISLPSGFQAAADEGLRLATAKIPLRSSIVDDPLTARGNRGDNTPVLVHFEEGGPSGRVRITLLAKGGGSENASQLCMLLPGDGLDGLKKAVLQQVKEKAPMAGPRVVVGVRVGSDVKGALELALKSLLRPLGERNARGYLADLEEDLLESMNVLGIGAAGLGGDITALDVHLEEAPTHIACLPVGIVICCHSLRRGSVEV